MKSFTIQELINELSMYNPDMPVVLLDLSNDEEGEGTIENFTVEINKAIHGVDVNDGSEIPVVSIAFGEIIS